MHDFELHEFFHSPKNVLLKALLYTTLRKSYKCRYCLSNFIVVKTIWTIYLLESNAGGFNSWFDQLMLVVFELGRDFWFKSMLAQCCVVEKNLINKNIKQKLPSIKSTLANNMMSGFEYQIAAPLVLSLDHFPVYFLAPFLHARFSSMDAIE